MGPELGRFDDNKALHRSKVTDVEGGDRIACLDSSCGENDVVRANHLTCGLKLSPKPGMLEARLLGIAHEFEEREESLEKKPALRVMNGRCVFHSMPQLGNSDGGELEFFVG